MCICYTGTPFPRESGTSLAPGLNTNGTRSIPFCLIQAPYTPATQGSEKGIWYYCSSWLISLYSESDISSLTEEQKFSWLIQWFVWVVVSRIGSALKSVPSLRHNNLECAYPMPEEWNLGGKPNSYWNRRVSRRRMHWVFFYPLRMWNS